MLVFRRVLLSVLLSISSAGTAFAQTAGLSCANCPGATLSAKICFLDDTIATGFGCGAPFQNCQPPELLDRQIEVIENPPGVFEARLLVEVKAPFNSTAITGKLVLFWNEGANAASNTTTLCQMDPKNHAYTLVFENGLTCGGAPYLFGLYSLRGITCRFSGSCEKQTDLEALSFLVTGQMLGCPVIPTDDCERCEMNRTVGPAKTGIGGGGPVCLLLPGGGPGADLHYRAGGAGAAGLPGSAAWNVALGRHWSHDYAQRIVLDPDETHVWLITERGTFREFGNLVAGDYATLRPSDEKRTLHRIGLTGWELRDPDGTVVEFGDDGRWLSTTDRNGNQVSGTYTSDELVEVDFPDGRSELFTYDGTGKLATIIEVGVTGGLTRSWTYTWNGDDLERVDRPDGTAWVMTYDPLNPGRLQRLELEASDGMSRRVETAWEHDAEGNVSKVWRGDEVHDGPDAVDLWQLAYDDPVAPTTTTVTDPVGDVATYVYDRDPFSEKPRLLSVSGSCPQCGLAASSTLVYGDAANPLLPTEVTDGNDNVTRYAYDADTGRRAQRIEAYGLGPPLERQTDWKYEHASYPGLVTETSRPSVEAGELRRTLYQRNADGDVEVMRILGFEAGLAFDLATKTDYNAGGRALSVDPPGHGDAPGFVDPDVTTYAYDGSRGNGFLVLESRTDPVVGTTTFGHDDLNRQTTVTDPSGVTTVTAYDALDRVTSVTRVGETSPAGDLVTTYGYDDFGDLVHVELPRGNFVDYVHDLAGRLTEVDRSDGTGAERVRYTLDAAGNRMLEIHERWDPVAATWEEGARTAYVYDSRCHLGMTIAGTAPEQSVTEYAYDCNGNLKRTWDANHPSLGKTATPTTAYAYDALDRLVSVERPWSGVGTPPAPPGCLPDPGFQKTCYVYDVQDHLTAVTDAEGSMTSYVYSDRDLLTEEISPVSGTTTHGYDGHGELTSTLDARGKLVTRVLDPFDRVTEVHYPDSALDTTYAYDDPTPGHYGQGRLAGITRHGQTVAYAYDVFGRMTHDGDLAYEYDDNGNRRRIVYPGGMIADYGFDFADREETLTVTHGALVTPVVTAAGYFPAGPLGSLTLGNGAQETRLFDERYHPQSIALAAERTRSWAYDTDGVGNVTEIAATADCPAGVALSNVTYDGAAVEESCSTLAAGPAVVVDDGADVTFRAADQVILRDGFHVAAAGRFVAAVDPSLSGDVTKSYAYQDVEYFLTSAAGPWGALDWTYDRIGNRLTEDRNGFTDVYSYEPNAVGGHTALLSAVALGTSGSRNLSYTPAGHQTQVAASGNTVAFGYDDEGRLSEVSRPTAPSVDPVDFLYDGRSFLTQAGDLATTGVVYPTYDSRGLLHALRRQEDVAEPERRYHLLYLAGRPVAQLATESGQPDRWWFLTTDHLGTPLVATDANLGEQWENEFEPFGRDPDEGTPASALAAEMFLRFPGQWEEGNWQQPTLGARIAYNVHRWYQPTLGRHGRVDPLNSFLRGREPFAYAQGNPLRYIDPQGLISWSCEVIEASVGAGGAAALFYAACTSECKDGEQLTGEYALGGFGFGAGSTAPIEIGAWDLEDGTQQPDTGSLEGSFTYVGCSATLFIGPSYSATQQGKGIAERSGSPSGGLGLGCIGVTGGSKLLRTYEKCCDEPVRTTGQAP